MKRILFSLLLLLVAAFSLSAQAIRNIDETVVLRKDGSARITQVWDVTVVSGTEFYLPFDNLGPMEIDDLTVSENGEEFYGQVSVSQNIRRISSSFAVSFSIL